MTVNNSKIQLFPKYILFYMLYIYSIILFLCIMNHLSFLFLSYSDLFYLLIIGAEG